MQTLTVKSSSGTPAAPHPSCPSSKGHSGLSRASLALSQMDQVNELVWGLREQLPLWTKPHWDVRVSVPREVGMRTQSPVLPPQRSAGSLPALKEGPSGQPPLESGLSLLGPLTTVGRLALGEQETTSLLGPVPSGASRIPWYHSSFSTLGNFVSS